MQTIITLILSILADLVPMVSNSSTAGKIIAMLQNILPALVGELQALISPVKNIIAALQGNGALTADQVAALQALDAECDAALDAAAKDAGLKL